MKRAGIFSGLIFISFLSVAQVQRIATPSKQPDSVMRQPGENAALNENAGRKQMMRELNLTRDQRAKIKEIRQSNMAKKDAIANDDKLTQEQKDVQLRELKRAQAQSTMTILNDEQKAKIKNMREERRGKGQQNQNN
jgi:Spy/CpxP family protein refolding chaperone